MIRVPDRTKKKSAAVNPESTERERDRCGTRLKPDTSDLCSWAAPLLLPLASPRENLGPTAGTNVCDNSDCFLLLFSLPRLLQIGNTLLPEAPPTELATALVFACRWYWPEEEGKTPPPQDAAIFFTLLSSIRDNKHRNLNNDNRTSPSASSSSFVPRCNHRTDGANNNDDGYGKANGKPNAKLTTHNRPIYNRENIQLPTNSLRLLRLRRRPLLVVVVLLLLLRRRLLPATIAALSIAMAEKVPQKRPNARALRRRSGSPPVARFSSSFLPLRKSAPGREIINWQLHPPWMNGWIGWMDRCSQISINSV